MRCGIERVGVIGAGAMGAGIAAIVANAGIPVIMLDVVPESLTPDQKLAGLRLTDAAVRNSLATAGMQRISPQNVNTGLPPSGLMSAEAAALVTVGNLDDHFHLLADADWIVEAIIEKPEPKRALMQRLETIRKANCIVSTNTSGLPVSSITAGRSESFKAHFFGTHFFNPPRYMRLLEIIATPESDAKTVQRFVDFAETELGKKIVYCNDTPNFIANRIVAMTTAFTAEYALANGYTIEETDLLTGPLIGRSRTATFLLQDWVGVDVVSHVTDNLYELVPDDAARETLQAPQITRLRKYLLQNRMLGLKTGQGFYRQVVDDGGKVGYLVLNPCTMTHEPFKQSDFAALESIKDEPDVGKRLEKLFFDTDSADRAARLAWATVSNQLAYAASKVPEIVDRLFSVDNAMRWGFGYQLGPFELWDSIGVRRVAAKMQSAGAVIPAWVVNMLENGCESFYRYENGRAVDYYDLFSASYQALPADDRIVDTGRLRQNGAEILRNKSAGLLDLGDGVLLLELRQPQTFVDEQTMQMLKTAAALLTENSRFVGMVISSSGDNFCRGVSPAYILETRENGNTALAGKNWQQILLSLRYSAKPVVSGIRGRAVCGGAEIALASSGIVAHAESRIGLLEVMAGLIPGGGGIKELVRRKISGPVLREPTAEQQASAMEVFDTVYTARMSANAADARKLGFLSENDRIVMNQDFLIHEAKLEVLRLVREGYRAASPANVFAGGLALYSKIKGSRSGEYADIRDALACVVAGGVHNQPQLVDEQHFLDLEQQFFVALSRSEKTAALLKQIV